MKKINPLFYGLLVISYLFLPCPALDLYAKEKTARLFFDKTAYPSAQSNRYVVESGECLSLILHKQLGRLRKAELQRIMEAVKALNPGIADVNKIYPGQVLLLPSEGKSVPENWQTVTYTARKGDNLVRIITEELKEEPQDIYKTVQLIKQFNPEIRDVNRIYPGQTLRIPKKVTETGLQVGEPPRETVSQTKPEVKETVTTIPQGKLSLVRQVLSRINGNLSTQGNYYIPLPQSGQVTIDCSVIPIVELDDGSVIALDFGGRLPQVLKQAVHSSWQSYQFVKIGEADSAVTILQKIVKASKLYKISRGTKPLVAGKSPDVRVIVDWAIAKRTPRGGESLAEGLSFLNDESQILPAAIRAYTEKNGIALTEVVKGGSVADDAAQAPTCLMPALGTAGGGDLSFSLLTLLGYDPVRSADVKVFDQDKDGFNLAITADILVTDGKRKAMILTKKVPVQFADILRASGTEVVLLSEGESRKGVIEKTLTAMRIPFVSRSFSFSFSGTDNKIRGTVSFPAIQMRKEEAPFYFVDFDMDPGIYCLLRDRWGVKALRY